MQCAVCGNKELEFLFHTHNDWQVRRCQNCGLVQVCPLPTQLEISQLYQEDLLHFKPYIEQLAVHRRYFQKKLRWIGEKKVDKDNRRLLDVGCAMGVLLVEAKKFSFAPVGLDISRDAIKYCRAQGLNAYKGSLGGNKSDLPKNLSFDVVTAFEIIEHESDPVRMLKEIYKLLAPGGLVVVTTPNCDSWWRVLMGRFWPGYQHPEHLFFFDPGSVRYIFNLAGFLQVEITKDEPRPFPISFVLQRIEDYFPILKSLIEAIGRIGLIRPILKLRNPFDPWTGMQIVAYTTKTQACN